MMILSASGGLVYHTRAAFNFPLWELTRRSVSTLVRTWIEKTRPEKLIVIGPSAGYLLEPDVFASIHELVVLDPDPIASILFRRRFHSVKIRWIRRADLLPFISDEPEAFLNFISSEKSGQRTAVLFFGVLGQIDLHQNTFKRTKTDGAKLLKEALDGVLPWASLHDVTSTVLGTTVLGKWSELAKKIDSTQPDISAEERIAIVNRQLEALGSSAGDWIDHESSWIGKPSRVIPWNLSGTRLHLMGWTSFAGID